MKNEALEENSYELLKMTPFDRDLFENAKINNEPFEIIRNDLLDARDPFGDLFLDLFKNIFSKEIFSETPMSIPNFPETSKTIFSRIRTFRKIL